MRFPNGMKTSVLNGGWGTVLKRTSQQLYASVNRLKHSGSTAYHLFFPEVGVGQTQAWMPTYISILSIPQMI
jgi:hypothetical protein